MRLRLAAIVLMALPVAAAAQSRSGDQAALPVLPPIGLPLAPIGLPLPAIGLPPLGTQPSAGPSRLPPGREHGAPRSNSRHDGRSRPSVVYLVPTYDWAFPGVCRRHRPIPAVNPRRPRRQPSENTGILHLDIEAAGPVQAFADGYYVGTLAELENEIELDAGSHRIELRAAGYEPLALDVRITASRDISYRTALTRTALQQTPGARDATPPAAEHRYPIDHLFHSRLLSRQRPAVGSRPPCRAAM